MYDTHFLHICQLAVSEVLLGGSQKSAELTVLTLWKQSKQSLSVRELHTTSDSIIV